MRFKMNPCITIFVPNRSPSVFVWMHRMCSVVAILRFPRKGFIFILRHWMVQRCGYTICQVNGFLPCIQRFEDRSETSFLRPFHVFSWPNSLVKISLSVISFRMVSYVIEGFAFSVNIIPIRCWLVWLVIDDAWWCVLQRLTCVIFINIPYWIKTDAFYHTVRYVGNVVDGSVVSRYSWADIVLSRCDVVGFCFFLIKLCICLLLIIIHRGFIPPIVIILSTV